MFSKFVDSVGQAGWTLVVKRKKKTKNGAESIVCDPDSGSSDEELCLVYARQVVYKKVDGIPGLSIRK